LNVASGIISTAGQDQKMTWRVKNDEEKHFLLDDKIFQILCFKTMRIHTAL
jgi:hypothetical protein